MTPHRYEQINALADAALAMAADRRAAFLDAACGGDRDLRDRVDQLIAAESSQDDFLESPALDLLAKDIAASRPARDLAGRRLGRYNLISRVGSGGNAEVWLALDEQLNREVALKLLSDGFTGDTAHVRRFQQEARAASALNHPNIVTIHDIGKLEGIDFIAQEFVNGETLRKRLESGPLAPPDVLKIGLQITAALQAAHGAGIVHRDIKPENIMIRPDGLVKVLDFGLAIFTEQLSVSASRAVQALTKPGLVLGTVTYMSPEQARALPVDARSDIFSLGIVLYEMSTGSVPFSGETPSDTIAAILKHEPPPFLDGSAADSADLERIIRRCLRKDKDQRYSTVHELGEELTRLTGGSDSQKERASGGKTVLESGNQASNKSRIWLAALAAFLFLVAGVLAFRTGNSRDLAKTRFTTMKISRPTTHGNVADAAISADGRYIAYVASEGAGQSVWLTERTTSTDLRILPPEAGQHSGLAFAPNAAYVYYRRAASGVPILYRVSVRGGAPEKILDGVSGPISFSHTGRLFAFVRLNSASGESAIHVANADGSGERTVAVRQRPNYFNHRGLAWSADERSIACFAGSSTAYTKEAFHLIQVGIADKTEKLLTLHTWAVVESMVWLHKGDTLLFNASERSEYSLQIWMVSLPGGTVTRVTNDLDQYARLSITSDDKTLAALQAGLSADIWVARPGIVGSTQITYGTVRNLDSMAWTPDGRIVYSAEAGEFRNLWIMDGNGGNPRQLTTGPGDKSDLVVTPGGRSIIYQSEGRIWRVDLNGANPMQLTYGSWDVHPNLSPDGKSLFYASFTDWSPAIGSEPALWMVPAAGGKPIQLTRDPTSFPRVSPDGKRLACLSYPGGDPRFSTTHLSVYDLAAVPPHKIFDRLLPAETDISWSPNGAAIDYIQVDAGAGNIWRQPLNGNPPSQITQFATGELFRIVRSTDGARLGIVRGNHSSALVLITDFH
jgi:eukaryotic-like serine/threonine-protein kinase